jgi:NAD(P)-dependent dehydrogenase (short-subunit alcohol dehydrogenase family)
MINFTRSLAVAYAKYGIRANCVAPGYVDTPMIASVVHVFDDAQVASSLAPLARPGTPEEIANCCLFLASDMASYCTGAVLVVDGGTTARV